LPIGGKDNEGNEEEDGAEDHDANGERPPVVDLLLCEEDFQVHEWPSEKSIPRCFDDSGPGSGKQSVSPLGTLETWPTATSRVVANGQFDYDGDTVDRNSEKTGSISWPSVK
jgi:hypothetical protein